MNARTLPRTAVDGYLRLVRLPLDTAIGWLPGNGNGPAPAAKLAVDRADASVRAVVAAVLRDPVLREDAQARRAAAEERERALRLRAEAQRKSERAESRLEQRHDDSERLRKEAKQRSVDRRESADRKRDQKTRRASEAKNSRVAASRKAASRADKAVDDRARKARLNTLDAKAEALGEQEQALTARDEAKRLQKAAGRVKEERKNSSG